MSTHSSSSSSHSDDRLEAHRLVNECSKEQLFNVFESLTLEELRSMVHRTIRSVSTRRVRDLKQRLTQQCGDDVLRPSMSLLGLPKDVCHHIFSFLDVYTMWFGACFVSRGWRKVVLAPESWKGVTFPRDPWSKLSKNNKEEEKKKKKSSHTAISYMQRWFSSWTKVEYLQFMLESSTVKESVITLLEQYVNNCPHLLGLNLNPKKTKATRDEHLRIISTGLSALKLQELQLNCYHVTNGGLEILTKGCPNLRTLVLHYLVQGRISNAGFNHIARCKRLERLEVVNAPDITAEGVQVVISSCPALTHIDFENVINLGLNGLKVVAQALPRLSYLRLSNCNIAASGSIENDFLLVGKTTPCLPSTSSTLPLFSEQSSSAFLGSISRPSVTLSTLLTSSDLSAFRGHSLALGSMLPLHNLSLENVRLNDSDVAAITQELPFLMDLNFGGGITDVGLIHIATSPCSGILKSLSIKEVGANPAPMTTDRGICCLALRCNKLEEITLGRHSALTQLSFLALSLFCPFLQTFNVSHNPCINDQTLQLLCSPSRSFHAVHRLHRLSEEISETQVGLVATVVNETLVSPQMRLQHADSFSMEDEDDDDEEEEDASGLSLNSGRAAQAKKRRNQQRALYAASCSSSQPDLTSANYLEKLIELRDNFLPTLSQGGSPLCENEIDRVIQNRSNALNSIYSRFHSQAFLPNAYHHSLEEQRWNDYQQNSSLFSQIHQVEPPAFNSVPSSDDDDEDMEREERKTLQPMSIVACAQSSASTTLSQIVPTSFLRPNIPPLTVKARPNLDFPILSRFAPRFKPENLLTSHSDPQDVDLVRSPLFPTELLRELNLVLEQLTSFLEHNFPQLEYGHDLLELVVRSFCFTCDPAAFSCLSPNTTTPFLAALRQRKAELLQKEGSNSLAEGARLSLLETSDLSMVYFDHILYCAMQHKLRFTEAIKSLTCGIGLGCPLLGLVNIEGTAVTHLGPATVLPKLHSIYVAGCNQLKPKGIRILAEALSLKKFRFLPVSSKQKIAIDYLKFLGLDAGIPKPSPSEGH